MTTPIRMLISVFGALLLAGIGTASSFGGQDVGAAPATKPQDLQSGGESQPPRLADYRRAKEKARAWIDRLEVDPVDLLQRKFEFRGRSFGIKGIKKLGEILETYQQFHRCASDPKDRERIAERVRQLARHTQRPEYHRLLLSSEKVLIENGTSYFRVLRLMEEFGLDTASYREHLKKAQPAIDAHLVKRGPYQRALFSMYYEKFGLERPAILRDQPPLAGGVICRRLPVAQYTNKLVYDLTHELYMAYDYGLRRTQTVLSGEDLAYVRRVLPPLTARYLKEGDPDLLAELVSCFTYIGFHDAPEYRQAIDYLLDGQHENGTWGNKARYDRYRLVYGDFVDQFVYLHTTLVAMRALIEVYEGNWAAGG